MNTRVYGAQKFKNLIIYSIGGHTDSIVNAFFEDQSLDVSFKKIETGVGMMSVWFSSLHMPYFLSLLLQGTKWALAHSHLRVGEAPGEYPSVCTGPYYRVPKKKNAISFI